MGTKESPTLVRAGVLGASRSIGPFLYKGETLPQPLPELGSQIVPLFLLSRMCPKFVHILSSYPAIEYASHRSASCLLKIHEKKDKNSGP